MLIHRKFSRGKFMNDLEKCFDKHPNIVSRRIADEVILVPIKQNVGDLENVYILNEVGSFIWDLIDGRNQLQEIKKKIVKEFDVNEREAEDDLITFIEQLVEIRGVSASEELS